jgi:hypothetical protein
VITVETNVSGRDTVGFVAEARREGLLFCEEGGVWVDRGRVWRY